MLNRDSGKSEYVIDGNDIHTTQDFYDNLIRAIVPGVIEVRLRTLDGLNDFLYRGDDKPERGFILVWKNSEVSRMRLGYPETVKQLEKTLVECHPANKKSVLERIEAAKRNTGVTMFDKIVNVIRVHPDVELILD